MTLHSNTDKNVVLLGKGRYVQLVKRDGWEYAERFNVTGIVVIVAITDDRKLVLIEQYRPPVRCNVVELPAGLAGDNEDHADEGLIDAARRELLEETGYLAESFEYITHGPPSAGIINEVITLFRARRLTRIHKGGGDSSENIFVHEIPLAGVHTWLVGKQAAGVLIDPKVYLGLYFGGL